MKSKYIYQLAICLTIAFATLACNSSSSDVTIGITYPDAQVNSFSVKGTPNTAIDTLNYPYLNAAKFAIDNKKYEIFTLDSLPVNTDINTLKVTIAFTGTPSRVDLVYKDRSGKDSIPEESWNTTDSIKFIQTSTGYLPELEVTAQDASISRRYKVNFKVHNIDPEGIKWEAVSDFDLKRVGESKTILINKSGAPTFLSVTKDKNSNNEVYIYTSAVGTPSWTPATGIKTDLPANTIINSLHKTDAILAIIDADGNSYTCDIATDGALWTKNTGNTIKSILGLLPKINSVANNEFLITYLDASSKLSFGKTTDFKTITSNFKLTGRADNLVPADFPVKDFSSINLNDEYLVLVAGLNQQNDTVNRSWLIRNTSSTNTEISLLAGNPDKNIVPYETRVTAFAYDSEVYAVSGDSLGVYNSAYGDTWKFGGDKQKLDEKMADMNLPSVVVDSENYIWIFGGVSNSKPISYSQKVWKGRINKLSAGYIR